jgi:hypothetical protein
VSSRTRLGSLRGCLLVPGLIVSYLHGDRVRAKLLIVSGESVALWLGQIRLRDGRFCDNRMYVRRLDGMACLLRVVASGHEMRW